MDHLKIIVLSNPSTEEFFNLGNIVSVEERIFGDLWNHLFVISLPVKSFSYLIFASSWFLLQLFLFIPALYVKFRLTSDHHQIRSRSLMITAARSLSLDLILRLNLLLIGVRSQNAEKVLWFGCIVIFLVITVSMTSLIQSFLAPFRRFVPLCLWVNLDYFSDRFHCLINYGNSTLLMFRFWNNLLFQLLLLFGFRSDRGRS